VTLDEHPAATGSIVAWAKVSRARVWDELRFPEGRLYEDQVIAQRMLVSASAFDTIPDVVVRWRMRPDGSSITQRESELAVLHDCLDAMAEGLDVLAGHEEALRARIDLIRDMDVPRLRSIAESHPDPRYREALDAFEARLEDWLS
jgi:CDP-glycerol glycerophosphotransferase